MGCVMWGCNPSRGNRFISSPKFPDQIQGPLNLLLNGYHKFFTRGATAIKETDHPPASSIKVKNEWSYNYTPPVCPLSVSRDNFDFTFSLVTPNDWPIPIQVANLQ